jgi:hypothetical protein
MIDGVAEAVSKKISPLIEVGKRRLRERNKKRESRKGISI